jgi:hypothetical protein
MKSKKFFTFLIVTLALAAFFSGYILVRQGGTSTKSKTGSLLDKFGQENSEQETDAIAKGEERQPVVLSDKKVMFLTRSSDKNSVFYYGKNDGVLYELDVENKQEKAVSTRPFTDLIMPIWSPSKKEVINHFHTIDGDIFKHYDLDTSKTTDFSRNIKSVVFSPDGNLTASYRLEEETEGPIGKVIISQPNGSSSKKLLDTRLQDMTLSWPANNLIAVKTLSAGIFTLTQEGKFTKILDPILGLEEKWSPSGKMLIFSAFINDPENPGTILWIKDMESLTETPLGMFGSAKDCVWSIDDENVFCPVLNFSSTDTIHKINVNTGESKVIAELPTMVESMILSLLEDRLFFIDASDNKLYSIDL